MVSLTTDFIRYVSGLTGFSSRFLNTPLPLKLKESKSKSTLLFFFSTLFNSRTKQGIRFSPLMVGSQVWSWVSKVGN